MKDPSHRQSKRRLIRIALAAVLGVLAPLSASAREEVELSVVIDDQPPCSWNLNRLNGLSQQDVEVKLRSGGVQRWRGVEVTEVLKACGLDLASNLGGGFVSRRVLAARAADGYVAAFGLAEIDPRFGRKVPILVWQQPGGNPLPVHQGPLMLIAPEDARGSRGVRQLLALQVLAVR
jgi:hypothetical protein